MAFKDREDQGKWLNNKGEFNFVNTVIYENRTDRRTRTIVLHAIFMENFGPIQKASSNILYGYADKDKKLDASVSSYSKARMDNKRAWTHIIGGSVIKPAMANLLITEAERMEGRDTAIVKQGLGTTGNVTNYESAAELSYRYGDIIKEVSDRNIVDNLIPLLKNEEERLIIMEEVKYCSKDSIYSFNAFMIRPEVYKRLVERFRMNRSDNISKAFASILDFDQIEEVAKGLLELTSITSKNRTHYVENTIASLDEEDEKLMNEQGFSVAAEKNTSVSYQDYYYILNPDILLLLSTPDESFDDLNTRTVFVGLSYFADKKGSNKTIYIPEAVKAVVVEGKTENVTKKEKEELVALTKKSNATILDILKETDQSKLDEKTNAYYLTEEYNNFITLKRKIDESAGKNFIDTVVKGLFKTFRSKDKHLIVIDKEDTLFYPMSMFGLLTETEQALVTTKYDGSTEKVDDKFIYSFGVSSGDPAFFGITGFKNSGVFNTLKNSTLELRNDIKEYAHSIYTADSSHYISLAAKLTTQAASSGGWIKEVNLTSVRSMSQALDNAIRDDYMDISSSVQDVSLSDRIFVKKDNLVRHIDAQMTSTVVKGLNDNGSIEFTHYKNMEDPIVRSSGTILPSGIGYVVKDSLGNIINIHRLTAIAIPSEVIFEEVNEKPSTTKLKFVRQETSDRNLITVDFFNGSTFNENNVTIDEMTFNDLFEGTSWKTLVDEKHLKKLMTTSKVLEENLTRQISRYSIRRDYGYKTDYVNKETLEDFSQITVTIGKDYKSDAGYDCVALFNTIETEFWSKLKVKFVPLDVDISREVISRRCDLYEIIEDLGAGKSLVIDKNKYNRFLTSEEMKHVRDFRINNRTYELSDGFKEAYTEIAKGITDRIIKLYPASGTLRSVLSDVSKSKYKMNEMIIEEFNSAIAKFGLVERLFMLEMVFNENIEDSI